MSRPDRSRAPRPRRARTASPWPVPPSRLRRAALRVGAAAATLCVVSWGGTWASPAATPPFDSWLNARAFPDLAAAVNACPVGGTVFFPAGDYHVPAGGLVIAKSIALRGEPGTRLFPHAAARDEPVLRIDPGSSYLENIQLFDLELMNAARPAARIPGNYGLVCLVTRPGAKVGLLLLERVRAVNMGDDGIHLEGAATQDRCFVYLTLRNVDAVQGRGDGFALRAGNMVSVYDGYFAGNDGCGVRAWGSTIQFQGCGFENNCHSPLLDEKRGGQVYLDSCTVNRFDACVWEQFATPAQPSNKRGLTIQNSPGCTVGSSWFLNYVEDPDPRQRGIVCSRSYLSGVMAYTFLPNRFDNVKTAIEVDSTAGAQAEDCVVFPQMVVAGTGAMLLPSPGPKSGLVRLGGRVRSPQGELIPRGTGLSALPTSALPALGPGEAGTLLFDLTRRKLVVWDGGAWQVTRSE